MISTKFKYKGDKKNSLHQFHHHPRQSFRTQCRARLHHHWHSHWFLLWNTNKTRITHWNWLQCQTFTDIISLKYTLTLKISLSISIYLVLYIYYHIPVIYIHCHYIIKIKNLVYKDITLATKLNQTKEIFLSKLQIP